MTDTGPVTPPTDPTPPTAPEPPDPVAAELAKWKATSRTWEDRAKAAIEESKTNATAAKELQRLKAASMSEQERAVEEARQQTRAEVLRELGGDRVRDAARVAFAGRSVDVEALLEGFEASAFVKDDGTPDVDKVNKWADRIAPATPPADPPGAPRVPTGPRTPTTTKDGARKEFADLITAQLHSG